MQLNFLIFTTSFVIKHLFVRIKTCKLICSFHLANKNFNVVHEYGITRVALLLYYNLK